MDFETDEHEVRDQWRTDYFDSEPEPSAKPTLRRYEDDDIDLPPPIPEEKAKKAVEPEIRHIPQPAVKTKAEKTIKEEDIIEDLRNNLQKAIIWSEILAPPVSLRE
jgi:hypothetical protein